MITTTPFPTTSTLPTTFLQETLADLPLLCAPLVLAMGGLSLLVLGAFIKNRETAFTTVRVLSVALVLGALYSVWCHGAFVAPARGFAEMIAVTGFSQILFSAVLVLGAGALLLGGAVPKESPLARFEYPVLLVFSLLGMGIMLVANDLMIVYLGLELTSLPMYVLVAMNRNAGTSSEAGLKYFVLGSLASGLFLFGASFVYGLTGSTQFDIIRAALSSLVTPQAMPAMVVGSAFVLAAFAFKISAAPFHMWTPDVYQGAPMPITAFLAGAPKVAALGLLISILFTPFGVNSGLWVGSVVLLAVASLLVGSFAALRQRSVKRILAYSAIANMGYGLIAVVAGNSVGVSAAVLYMLIYAAMTTCAFALLLLVRVNGNEVDDVAGLKGLSTLNKPVAYGLAVVMFAMSGLPPMAGFFGKLAVFQAAVSANYMGLAVFGVLASVVSAFYYLNLIRYMFFDTPEEGMHVEIQAPFGVVFVALASFAFVLAFPLFANSIATLADAAGNSFVH